MKSFKKVITSLITQLNGMLVVVEGKRDVIALSNIGVRSEVITFDRFIRNYEPNRVDIVILTDRDRSGRIKYQKVKAEAIARGHNVHDDVADLFWRVFGAITVEDVPLIFHELMEE